jgi:competence ComEA-like helix-hairpin-helix protein
LNSYNPGGESWWGHCNGWAAAAILTNEPTESVYSDINGQQVAYTTADLKGLFSEAHYSTRSRFYGARYNGEEDDVTDLSPKAFHQLVTYYIREMGVPMVFDTTATEQVWNFPVWGADLDVSETTPEGLEDAVNINTDDLFALVTLPGISDVKALAIIDYREANGPFQDIAELENVSGIGPVTMSDLQGLITIDPFQRTFSVVAKITLTTDGVNETHVDSGDPDSFGKTYRYTLETDSDGVVVGGEWQDTKEHPDFAWIPYYNPRSASQGSSENPYLDWGELLEIVGSEFERE